MTSDPISPETAQAIEQAADNARDRIERVLGLDVNLDVFDIVNEAIESVVRPLDTAIRDTWTAFDETELAESELSSLPRAMRETRERAERAEQTITALRSELADHAATIADLRNELMRVGGLLAESDAELADAKATIARLEQTAQKAFRAGVNYEREQRRVSLKVGER